MIKKIRIYFILVAFAFLFLMQALIVYFTYHRSYKHLIQNSDEILNQILNNESNDNISGYHYFVVTMDANHNISNINIVNTATVVRKSAANYTKTAMSTGSDTGFVEGYRFMIKKEASKKEIKVAFLLRSGNFSMLRNNTISMIIFSAIALLIILITLIPVSKLLVWPLEESNRKQKAFITTAGHALKTPLTIISTSADLLSDDLPDSQWINVIKDECAHLTDMTNELILISKMEAKGKTTNNPHIDFPISDVLNEIIESFNPVFTSKNQTVSLNISKDLTYFGDENAIKQLFSLLIDNCTKYAGVEGEIIIELTKNKSGVTFSTTNTSPYYDNAQLSHLFDQFYRPDVNKETGFGIGLFVVKTITKAHKGKLFAKMIDDNHLKISIFLS